MGALYESINGKKNIYAILPRFQHEKLMKIKDQLKFLWGAAREFRWNEDLRMQININLWMINDKGGGTGLCFDHDGPMAFYGCEFLFWLRKARTHGYDQV